MAKKKKLNGIVVDTSNGYIGQDEYYKRYNSLSNQFTPISQNNITSDEIAPVKTTVNNKNKKGKKWYETIVESPEILDDGYDIGDITKSVLGSTADAGLNVVEGIGRVGEGIAKLGAGLIVEGIDLFNGGESEYTKGVRRRISGEEGEAPFSRLMNWLEDQVSDYSIFGESGDEVFSGIGYTMGMLEGGKVLPGGGNVELAVGGHVARLPILSAVGGAGSGLSEAYSKGATGVQAWEKALGSGAIESITESLFGFMGIGGNDITDEFAKKFTSKFGSSVAQHLAKIGISSLAEGTEEVISSASNQFLDKMIDKFSKEDDPKFYEKMNPDELAQEFVTSFLSTALTGGYDTVTNINHLSNNAIENFEKETGRQLTVAEKMKIREQVSRALANENTLNEQKVIDNEMNSRLAELGEYTRADRNRIRNEINQDLDNGRISIDSINNTLPGITDQWDAQFNVLRDLQDEIRNSEGAERDYSIREYQQKLQEYKQDERLRNSYVEEVNKRRTFNYNNENISDIANTTYQSAVESGMNNSKATHDLVDFASKMADYTGVNIKFTTNDYLKTLPEFADKMTDNTIVNGANVKSENTIYINKDSKKNLYTIIGHELGHLLDNAKEGEQIRKFAEKYANSRGEYFDRYSKLSKNYNENEISTEMANDIIGEYLFTNEEFVTKLATENPSTFKKIYNWFQHIFNLAKAGSQEARQLEQVRYNLEKGLEKINEKGTDKSVATNDIKYSTETLSDGTPYTVLDKDLSNISEDKRFVEAKKYISSLDGHIVKDMDNNELLIVRKLVGNDGTDKDVSGEMVYHQTKFQKQIDKEYRKELKQKILMQAEETLQNSKLKSGKPDIGNRHENYNITDFDQSVGLVYDGTNMYQFTYDVAVLNDGTRIPYDLKGVSKHNSSLDLMTQKKNLKTIMDSSKEEAGDGITSSSMANNIPQNEKKVNNTKYSVSEKQIQGLEDYTRDEIKNIATDYIKTAFLYSDVDADIKGMEIIGSRNRGTAKEDSDLDIVVELDGEDLREDDLFNVLNDDEEPLMIDGVKVDFNPIVSYRSGTLDEFMERSNEYDKEILDNSLNKQLERSLEKTVFGAENERQGMIDLFNSYLEENDITNPTKEDIDNSLDTYDLMDANDDGEDLNKIRDKYTKTIQEYLKSQNTDNKGKKLSTEQKSFFKESKIRDDKGRLLRVYHGTDNGDFNIFDLKKVGSNLFPAFGEGFYFDSQKSTSEAYTGKDGIDNIKTVYLNITNPYYASDSEVGKINRDELIKKGYDGVSVYGHEFVAFYSNQIKNIDNTNPTTNEDIRYSLSTEDSEGNPLSEDQQDFFKDSKMRDADGNLEVMYHGTSYGGFTVFDKNKIGARDSGFLGEGFYFTNDKQLAYEYSDADFVDEDERTTATGEFGNIEIKEVYLNIKNPFIVPEGVDYGGGMLRDLLGLRNNWEVTPKLKSLGYDGVIYKNGDEVLVFEPNQIKNIDNTNPTSNEDIRYSLSDSGETTDDEGRQLSEKQLKYFKNSKATNEKGQLETVYHTTTDETTQFNVFDPTGTDHYRFGNQVVNYFTNSKNMSGSYANQDYEEVDTKKITTMQEVKDYIKEVNDYNEGFKNIELIKEGDKYKILDKSKVNNYDKTTDQIYKEAQKYAESLTDQEKNIFEDIYASTRMGEFDSDGRFNVDAFLKARGYEYGSKEDLIAVKYLNEIDNRDYSTQKIYTDVLFNDGRYIELASFDNRKDLYRNIKEVLSDLHSISTPNSHYDNLQYQGYVNITNPYVLDAKGKNWNQVKIELTDELRKAYQNLTDSQKASIKDAMDWEDYGVYKDELSRYYKTIYLEDEGDIYGNEGYEVDLANVGKMLHDLYTPEAPEGVISWKAYSDMYNVANNGFTDEAIEKFAGLNLTTNDVVKQVLKMNEEGSNYDGVIMKNVVDYGGKTYEGHDSADIFVTFESNQFKAVDNINPTKDEDIRYSLSDDEEIAPVKTLPKSYEPFLEFAKEKGFLDEDEKMMIFNGVDKEDKTSVKEKVTKPREGLRNSQVITPEKSQLKKTIDLLDYMFVNRNSEIDNLAKDSGNMNIKYYGDMLNGVSGEAQNEILYGQTDNYGERIGKSINELFDWANKDGLSEAFNDYLLHYSNIDRHRNGKGSRVHQETSEKMVEKYEKEYPQFKQHAKEVWDFSKNVRDNLLNAGLINESTYDYLSETYPHYVPYMEEGDITQYIDDTGKLKPRSVIKTAKGGATYTALTPVQEALTKYIYSEKKSIRQNDLYREIYNTLEGEKMSIGADDRVNPVETGTGLYRDENGSFLTAYFDGELNAIRISDDLYDQLNHKLENQIKDLEQNLSLITKPLQTISNIRRNLLTTWSPSFLVKNPIKDFGDAIINSKDTKGFMKNYIPAYGELIKDTKLAQQFKALYGSGNAMGEYESDSGLSTGKKVLKKGNNLLQRIANFNEIVELAPRFAEFKATLERGGSLQEAMYNAREVTINFNRGGVITKAMNRNGFTFLNASVQGFDKFIRNFSGQNGAMGVVGALMKATAFGVLPALFNHLMYAGGDEPDEDYEALPDYIKDNYYLIKTDNGTFVRIPKGRMMSVFGMVGRRTLEYAQGEEDAYEGMTKSIYDQVGFDPFNNNVFAPIQQAYFSGENGEAWYGGDLVPTRLQDKPAGEQYDESTDKISKWVGSKFGISPYKLNYVLDQYSGGFGDIFLPMITEEASSDAETLPEYAIAPIKDQFIIDSTMDNKYAGEFYQTKEDYTIKSNSAYATDEDILKNKYLSSVSSELSKLYQEKREVQSDTSLSKKQKYEKVQKIQDEINKLAKEGLEGFNQLSKSDSYAIVGDREYYKDGDEWKKVSDKELDVLNSLGLDLDEKTSYFNSKEQISNIKEDYADALEKATDEEKTTLNSQKKLEIINAVKNSNLTDEAKAYLYTKNYGDYATVNAINSLGISMNDYLDLESQNFTADRYANGKTVPNSKKNKTMKYINSMNLTMEQKVILAKLKYPSIDTYNVQILNYIKSNRYLDYDEKLLLLDRLGFKVENNNVSW